MMAVRRRVALALVGLAAGASTCSLGNHEGPNVTCEDLQCGRINACLDGIIASCADGKTVLFHVCLEGATEICDEPWQVDGAYKCDQYITECEGCRADDPACRTPRATGGEGGGASSAGGSPGAGGNGGASTGAP